MTFKKKKVGGFPQISSWKDIITSRWMIKTTVVLACIMVILVIGKWALTLATQTGKIVTQQVTKLASKQIGENMIVDKYGNINVMVAGYAGEQYRGGLLTDTVMVASYNPELGTVTFLSVPRDLYVEYGNGARGKLNSLYWAMYLDSGDNQQVAAESLTEKIEEVTGLSIPYYAFVSFDGFTNFVDTLGGIEVDVPYTLHDTDYPGPNDSYVTFHVDRGLQTFDGETSLKYARSRKSTSDFSRALRQQQLIESVINKVTQEAFKIKKIQKVYNDALEVVFTNISRQEIVGMGKYVEDERYFFSYVYTAECDLRYFDLAEVGCVLRYGDRQAFNGLSVMIPEGASPGNLSYYKHTQDFAFWVVHNQNFLKERAKLRVLNGIDKEEAKANGYRINGVATALSIELKQKGFIIDDIGNTPDYYAETFVVVPWTGSYQETVDTLSSFIDFDIIAIDQSYGSGVSIILGDDYLKRL